MVLSVDQRSLVAFLFLLTCFALSCEAATVSIVQSTLSQPSQQIVAENGRLRGIRRNDTDFTLSVLIPVHRAAADSSGGRCGTDLTDFGVQRVEEILYLLDRINSDTDLLPTVTLGYDIRDTCLSTNVALGESVDIIASSSSELLHLESCRVDTTSSQANPFLIGTLGATVSSVSVPVASLFTQFMIPQLSYASTSPLLSDKDRYGYFLRTVPSDDLQAKAIYKLVVELDFTLVSAIHSNDAYGEFGISEFRRLVRDNVNNSNVCIDFDEGVDVSFKDVQHFEVAARLFNESSANAVILFISTSVAENFLDQLALIESDRIFHWIVSDSISQSTLVKRVHGDLLNGMLGIQPFSQPFEPFESFFANVTLNNNKRNSVWYSQYCNKLFNTSVCNPNESVALSSRYVSDTVSVPLVTAVYAFAHGLDKFLKENCAQPVVWNRTTQTCEGQNRSLTRDRLLYYIQNLNFISPNGFPVMFDAEGNSNGLYQITTLQSSNSTLTNAIIGLYNTSSDSLQLNSSSLDSSTLFSQCTLCSPGSVVVPIQGSCCGTCNACLGNTSTFNVPSGMKVKGICSSCVDLHWGNNPLNGSTNCTRLEETYISHSSVWGVFIIVLSISGLLTLVAVVVFVSMFWTTPVIKSFGREQMVLLLIGLTLCYILPFFYILKPSFGICLVRRAGLWFCFSLVFGALFIKLVRITRIFLQVQATRRHRCIQPQYQILFTCLVVGGQMILAAVSLIVVHPNTTYLTRSNPVDSNDFPTLVLTCQTPHIALLILLILYDTVLIIVNSVLASFTIRFPENFNEARHVSFSTFAIGVVWLAFIPSYIATEPELKDGVIGFAVLLTAFSVLLCLFGPRIIVAITNHYKKDEGKKKETNNVCISSDLLSNPMSTASKTNETRNSTIATSTTV